MDTDVILLRCKTASADSLGAAAGRLCGQARWPLRLDRAAWSVAERLAYAYLRLGAQTAVAATDLQELKSRWAGVLPGAGEIDVSRLRLAMDVPGHAKGDVASHHYVVETDPEAGWEEEIARWYDAEHMPGLAAVPGCIHARRFVNLDSGPKSLACYDLVNEATLGSPQWLAVRGTPWSSRTRPHFTNTRRTMLQVIA